MSADVKNLCKLGIEDSFLNLIKSCITPNIILHGEIL